MLDGNAAPRHPSPPGSASFVRWMVQGIALVNLLIFGGVALSLHQSFGESEERAEVMGRSLSQVLALEIAGLIDGIDLTLLSSADEVERQLAHGGIDAQALNAFLARQQGRLGDDVFSLRMSDADGFVRYGHEVKPENRVRNSDREYFVRLRDDPKAGLVIGKPILMRIGGRWALSFSRAVHGLDGAFGGVVYVNVTIAHLVQLFSAVDTGRSGSVSLRDERMRILARHPVPADSAKVIGEPLVVPQLRELIASGRDAATYVTDRTVDGVERRFAVCKVPHRPLYVVVGRSTEEYLGRWRDHAVKTAVLAALFCLTTLVSSWLVYRSWRRQSAAVSKVHELNRDLERRVTDRTAQLEAANQELESFSYSVSHDLRAPLRHVEAFLARLEGRIGATLDGQGRHDMAAIGEAARRMDVLIGDLLSFSRMGRSEMTRTPVDLGELVQEALRELDPDTRGRIIHWSLGELPSVAGDRAMLRVVLVNLISNALKFTRHRAEAEIEIGRLPEREREVVVFVRDNGAGFDMKFAGKLFGVFQRLHRADEFEGTGIGLASVRRVITKHGGRTWAEGKVDGGATFYFSLPLSPAEPGHSSTSGG